MSGPHMDDRDFLRGCIIACLAGPLTPQQAISNALESVKLEAALYSGGLADITEDNLELFPHGKA